MKKKFLSMITAIVMLISLLPQGILTVSAAITATQPTGGDGTANNPYKIGTAAELYWFAAQVNGGTTDINAVLTENIVVNTGVLKSDGTLADDTSGFTSWTPIGNSSNQYIGTFDGQGHTVSGLYFNNTNAYNVGLFGYVSSNETNKGSVSNVGVVDSYFNGYVRVGGVCGYNSGTITNCYSTAAVIGANQVGGVCGENYGVITDCYNIGTVSSLENAGGVCGMNSGTIANSYNIGIVSGTSNVGGVCGSTGGGTIENCYSTAAVIGANQVGGVCGENHGTIAFCYNTGTVSGTKYVGGVCGFNSVNTPIANCYFDSEKYSGNAVAQNGSYTVTNVEGKTTDKFASGEVAYLLQSGQKADENGNIPEVWGQNIGTDNSPVLTSDIAKKVLRVEFKTLSADGEYTLYAEKYGNYDEALSDFPEEITGTIWVDGVNQFAASSRVTEDKTVYPVGYSVKYNDDGKVVISAPKPGNYKIIIASYSGESLLKVQSAGITLESWVDLYEITDLNGFDTTGADKVKVFFWDTEMRPQCDAAVKTLS